MLMQEVIHIFVSSTNHTHTVPCECVGQPRQPTTVVAQIIYYSIK